MDFEKMAGFVPESLWNEASENLIDVILNSSNANKMPSNLAKTFLYYWQKDQIATELGLQLLFEASILLEPDKTVSLMEELGLSEVVAMLK
jgi:hypothetical protein